jgi:hypothetical protein
VDMFAPEGTPERGYSSEQISCAPANVLPFRNRKFLLTAAPELDARADHHHVPDDAIVVRHAPAYICESRLRRR